jgi:hypothetical protein
MIITPLRTDAPQHPMSLGDRQGNDIMVRVGDCGRVLRRIFEVLDLTPTTLDCLTGVTWTFNGYHWTNALHLLSQEPARVCYQSLI